MEDIFSGEGALGLFSAETEIGDVRINGGVKVENGRYTVCGSGVNMWFRQDAFHFVWTKASGDISLSADITFVGNGANAHRKACLIIRQSLESNSAYADAALHGDGLAALQYRDEAGSTTHDIHSNISWPTRLRIEKRGAYAVMWVSDAEGNMAPAGGSVRVEIEDEFYVGLAVCSHEADVLETAIFENVELLSLDPVETPVLYSTLETVSIASTDREVVKVFKGHIEAPNWTNDGKTLVYNSGGLLYQIPAEGGEPTQIDTGFATRCNNDHGLSPDGHSIVISDQSQETGQSIIYTLPFEGGAPTRITANFPSYWHGWSPDGQTLAYCAQRDGKWGIFTIPVSGGEETRLTTAPGLDDGPDYSPDGKFIYFNSDRTGLMQIWRIAPDGSALEQMTFDDAGNWFAHISPDGNWMVFLTYDKSVKGHPANQDVMLRLMRLGDRNVTVLAKLFGGQGTINVPSWSPDSRNVAFVSYQLLP